MVSKTSTRREFGKGYAKQLVGYYVLSLIGGIENAPMNTSLDRLGVYASRFGKAVFLDINEVLTPSARQRLISIFSMEMDKLS